MDDTLYNFNKPQIEIQQQRMERAEVAKLVGGFLFASRYDGTKLHMFYFVELSWQIYTMKTTCSKWQQH